MLSQRAVKHIGNSRGKIIGEISKKPVWELIRATSSPLKPREKTRNNLKRYFRYSCLLLVQPIKQLLLFVPILMRETF